MKQLNDYKLALAAVRELRGTTGTDRMIALLNAAIEQWKEQAIGKPADQVAQLHGAILKVRELIGEITRELPPQRDGGYI